ncbi:hypothetical protein LG3211_3860 [Lysobacter gummosus]|nr:hypothetical protein LG3211_3860 [Lysobacter gummosus]
MPVLRIYQTFVPHRALHTPDGHRDVRQLRVARRGIRRGACFPCLNR